MNKLNYYCRHIGYIKTLFIKGLLHPFFCKKHKNIIFFLHFPVSLSFDMCLNKLRVVKFILQIRI